MQIRFVPAGRRFVLRGRTPDKDITGTLIKVNECRAHVKLEANQAQRVQFTDKNGKAHDFVAVRNREDNWSPSTEVELEK